MTDHARQLQPSGSIVSRVTAGFVVGGLAVTLSLSLAALIFSGPLSPFLPVAIRVILLGAAVVSVAGALTGSLPGTILVPQSAPAALTALMAAALAGNLAADAVPAGRLCMTVMAALAGTTLCTGVVLLLLGKLRLGAMVRFVPYPVFGGFLAGTGWLLVQGAMRVMTDLPLATSNLALLGAPGIALRWVPGLIFALVLLVVLARYNHLMVMPVLIVSAIGLFYGLLSLMGLSTVDAVSRGLLAPSFASTGWLPQGFAAGGLMVSWPHMTVIFHALPALLVISVVDLLFSASALELAVAKDIDLNRELKAAGVANLLAGIGGGIIGYQSMTFTVLSRQISPDSSRIPGLVSAALCALTLIFGSALLHLFPKPVLGGLLMFLGFSFLREWLWDAYFRLSPMDYGIVVLILLVIVLWGFMAGLAVGMVAAVALFVVDYSRIDVIKHALAGDVHRSNVDRSEEEHRLLKAYGEAIHVFKLQGFIFFGTASTLLEAFRCRVRDGGSAPLGYAVFDFNRVTALDASAVYSFLRMRQLAEADGVRLVLTHLSGAIGRRLEKGGLVDDPGGRVRFFPDLDRGLEWCEDAVLAGVHAQALPVDGLLAQRVRRLFTDPDLAERLMGYLVKQTIDAGAFLMRQGDPADALFFIESGQVTTLLETDDGKTIRLRTMQPGTVVGEIGLYLDEPRSASVVADRPTTVYCLSGDALGRMRKEAPDIAAEFHRFIACLLAERLVYTNAALKSLQD
ncbi:MAG: SLC26A/SulP transporter family protein [Desulfobacterales bacterium]|nr:SLC26A/SulP transporter family protein [Desulfobacterales bacterium]